MSHFTEMKVHFKQKNEADFVAALEVCFGKGNVEVHENGAALLGYQGDNRSTKAKSSPDYAPPCHIIIRRKAVGSAANDVGYRRTEEGGYIAFISDHDKGHNYKTAKQNAVAQDYTLRVAEKKLKSQGYTFKREVLQNGTVKIVATKYG